MLPANLSGDAMFMPRAAGTILLAYALFNIALGLNRDELPWMLSGLLLAVAGLALLLPRRESRGLVFGAAAAAAAIGMISQFHAARATGEFLGAAGAWLVWTSLWLSTAWVGARYLPPGQAGGSKGKPEVAPAAGPDSPVDSTAEPRVAQFGSA